MNDNAITPIRNVQMAEASALSKVSTPTETVVTRKPASSEEDKSLKSKENESTTNKDMSNVSIYFRIDDETNDVTVIVVDRQSKRVLRTIPACELQKMQAGELLKLTA